MIPKCDGKNGFSLFCGINIFATVAVTENIFKLLGFSGRTLEENSRQLEQVLHKLPRDKLLELTSRSVRSQFDKSNRYYILLGTEFEAVIILLDTPEAKMYRTMLDLGKTMLLMSADIKNFPFKDFDFVLPTFTSALEPSGCRKMVISDIKTANSESAATENVFLQLEELRELILCEQQTNICERQIAASERSRTMEWEQKLENIIQGIKNRSEKMELEF